MSNVQDIEDLKHSFNSKPETGEKLPNVKDMADKTSFFLKNGDTYEEHIMFNGNWHRKVVNSLSQTVLQKVG